MSPHSVRFTLPVCWRIRTPHNSPFYSFILLLVRCHQLRCHSRRNHVFGFSFFFIHCHLSLSSIITITYSLSINPRQAMSVLWHPQRICGTFIYVFFLSPTTHIRCFCIFSLAWFSMVRRAYCVFCCRMFLCAVARACRCSARLSNFLSHARVIQFIYCLSTPRKKLNLS